MTGEYGAASSGRRRSERTASAWHGSDDDRVAFDTRTEDAGDRDVSITAARSAHRVPIAKRERLHARNDALERCAGSHVEPSPLLTGPRDFSGTPTPVRCGTDENVMSVDNSAPWTAAAIRAIGTARGADAVDEPRR